MDIAIKTKINIVHIIWTTCKSMLNAYYLQYSQTFNSLEFKYIYLYYNCDLHVNPRNVTDSCLIRTDIWMKRCSTKTAYLLSIKHESNFLLWFIYEIYQRSKTTFITFNNEIKILVTIGKMYHNLDILYVYFILKLYMGNLMTVKPCNKLPPSWFYNDDITS